MRLGRSKSQTPTDRFQDRLEPGLFDFAPQRGQGAITGAQRDDDLDDPMPPLPSFLRGTAPTGIEPPVDQDEIGPVLPAVPPESQVEPQVEAQAHPPAQPQPDPMPRALNRPQIVTANPPQPTLPPKIERGLKALQPQPRRRPRLSRLLPSVSLGFLGISVAIVLAGAGLLIARSGEAGLSAGLQHVSTQASAGLGLRIAQVEVHGQNRVGDADIRAALALDSGAPMLAFDAEAARQRLEQVPWIESATVERHLPDTVVVRIVERTPLALWQHDGRFSVIDAKGVSITDEIAPEFAALPVVVGDEAPAHAEAFLMLLDSVPEIRQRVAASVFVGGRRWNLRLDNGIDVRLPEEDPAVAIGLLADLDRDQKLLARDVTMIDLRLPDRMVVQLASQPSQPLTKPKGRPNKS